MSMSEVQFQTIRCGKSEFLLNGIHLLFVAVINFIALYTAPSTGYVLLALNVVIYALFLIRLRDSGPLHLDIVFLLFLFIYSFSVPLSNSISSRDYDQNLVRAAAETCMLSYAGYSLGLLLDSGKHRRTASLHQISQRDSDVMRRSGMAVFFIGAISSVMAIVLTSGLSVYLSAGYAGRALLKREVGPVELGLYFSIVGLFGIFASTLLATKSRPISKFFVAFVFLFFFFYISFLGIRRPLFLLGLGLLAGYSLIKHRPKLITALPIGIVAFAFLTTFAQYRQLISSAGLDETIDFVRDNASAEWFDVSNTELGAPFRTLMDYMTLGLESNSLLPGESYIQTLAYALPGFITGGLQSLSVQYTHLFFSADFISIGGNMGLFPVTEAYLNFGPSGAFAVFVIFGFLLSKANRWFHAAGRIKPNHIILFMMLIPWCAFFMRLDMASFVKGFLYSQIVPLLIFQYFNYLQRPSSRMRN